METKKILLACMAKSGSTYLRTLISELPGFKVASWIPGHGRREQELCRETIIRELSAEPLLNQVAQVHVRYSEMTKRYIKEFELKPIVLVRNLLDIIPSLIDHHSLESTIYPFAYVPIDIVNWKKEKQEEFIVEMVMPWYINFYASWNDCGEKIMITYDNLMNDPSKILKKVCDAHCIQVSSEDIERAIAKTSKQHTRKNVGISGRGQEISKSCQEHLLKMISYYDDIDFSSIFDCPVAMRSA